MNKINIQLSFDAPDGVSAGRTLRGILNITTPRTVKAHRLEVYFKGEEYAKVYFRRGQTVRTYAETHEICRTKISAKQVNALIKENNDALPEGSYQIPFQFRISSKLPSSVAIGDCNDSVKIEYALVAEMIGSGIIHDYEAKHIVQVTARPKSLKTVPFVVPPQCHTIIGGLFFNRGKVEFGAQADDTLLVPGQRLQLDLAIVNESLASIHSIRVHLQERVEWTVHEDVHKDRTHTTHKINCLFDESLDASAVAHKKEKDDVVKQNVRESFRMRQNFAIIEEQLAKTTSEQKNEDNVLSLTLPPVPKTAHNTHTGTFMKVRHLLTVTLLTHATNSNPEFQIPIRIMRGRPSQLLQLEEEQEQEQKPF